mmetsp:Transcript_72523/g.172927  ORF Transcript_72523/g.172927 Transcript_72523/m.172927 type:complete len:237 (+) Transcript_72523:753-1463(+)
MSCCCCTIACWCCMIWVWTSCCCCIASKKLFFSLCSSTFCRASRKLGKISSFSLSPNLTASPLAKATCMGPISLCSGMSTRCSCRSSIAFSASSSLPIRTKAHPTPLAACEAMTKTSRTSPNSSKHSLSCSCETSRGSLPMKSFTPPFSFSIQGRLSTGERLRLFDAIRRLDGERRFSRLTRRRRWEGLMRGGLSRPPDGDLDAALEAADPLQAGDAASACGLPTFFFLTRRRRFL